MATADTALTRMSITEAAGRIARGDLSPVELTEAYLARIAALNPRLNAYVLVTADAARAEARAAEAAMTAARGERRGPLHGIPVALKDLFDVVGLPTEAGSRIRRGAVANADSTVTRRLREAGAILLGKTNTHEFAFGVTTNNPHTGPTRNPWDTDRIPGGSSGGSAAAVAAGMAAAAMGTDTGGSIRIPASLCGVVGIKPTYGRVSAAGVWPLSFTLDHPGPLTRTVADAALMLHAIAGYDPADPRTSPVPVPDYTATLGAGDGVRGLRLGVPRSGFFDRVDGEVARAVEAAFAVFRTLGATVDDDIPLADFPDMGPWRAAVADIILAEARHVHADALATRPEEFGEDVRGRLTRRTDLSAAEFAAALAVRDGAIRQMNALVGRVSHTARYDALLLPATAVAATRIEGQNVTLNGAEFFAPDVLTRTTNPFNLTGMPAVSLPCGFTAGGLPIGLQIVSARWDDATALRVAAAYEGATDWHTRFPEVEV